MLRTLQSDINEWQEETFGPIKDLELMALRCMEEAVELSMAIKSKDEDKVADELADVFIVLCAVDKAFEFNYPSGSHVGVKDPDEDMNRISREHTAEMSYGIISNLSDILVLGNQATDGFNHWIEISDIVRSLNTLANSYDVSLMRSILNKMAINRARKWNVTPEGVGYHEKETKD